MLRTIRVRLDPAMLTEVNNTTSSICTFTLSKQLIKVYNRTKTTRPRKSYYSCCAQDNSFCCFYCLPFKYSSHHHTMQSRIRNERLLAELQHFCGAYSAEKNALTLKQRSIHFPPTQMPSEKLLDHGTVQAVTRSAAPKSPRSWIWVSNCFTSFCFTRRRVTCLAPTVGRSFVFKFHGSCGHVSHYYKRFERGSRTVTRRDGTSSRVPAATGQLTGPGRAYFTWLYRRYLGSSLRTGGGIYKSDRRCVPCLVVWREGWRGSGFEELLELIKITYETKD